jgi:hypothetical protein
MKKVTAAFVLLTIVAVPTLWTRQAKVTQSSKTSQSTQVQSSDKDEAQPDKLTVQLSDPTRPATLRVGLLNGSIVVQGGPGKEVIVETRVRKENGPGHTKELGRLKGLGRVSEDDDSDDEEGGRRKPSKQGLRLIPNNSSGLSVEEEDNEVIVSTGWSAGTRTVELHIQVPTNCSMKLSTVNEGDIEVSDVTGDLEINNTNGAVTLNRINGSVVAHALNEPLHVTFVKVNPQKSMSFSSLNGDVDVTFPADLKATLNMRSEQGEIYSDFDLDIEKTTSRVEEKGKGKGRYKVSIERALKAKINGGGQEVLFKNYNGNIYIRKAK